MNRKRMFFFWKVLLSWGFILCFVTTFVSAAPPDWIRSEDGLPASTSGNDPYFFHFGYDVFCVVDGVLYIQLYNQPCLGWKQVLTPSGANEFSSIGDYIVAVKRDANFKAVDLWWIAKGDAFISENWKKVTSTGIPAGTFIHPKVIFNNYIYGVINYSSNFSSLTFDIYRSSDIGKETVNWSQVVSDGFGDPQNRALGYLGVFKNKLIAVTDETLDEGYFGSIDKYLNGIEVWVSATGISGNWTQVNEDGFGSEVFSNDWNKNIRKNCFFGAALEYKGKFYVGTKSHIGAEIWGYDGTGLGGWEKVLNVQNVQGPGRVEDMVLFEDKLYVAEGFPTANLVSYDGSTWEYIEFGPHPFDPANDSLTNLALLPSRPTSSDETGDIFFALTAMWGGGYQLWSYPFPEVPLTCSVLKQATISVSPESATNELGIPGQTHTVIATVDTGSGVDFSQVWVSCTMELFQQYGHGLATGFVGTDGKFSFWYPAVQGPEGLWTDDIEACFWNSEELNCALATKTWVDTTPPVITITTPQDGGKYMLHEVVIADYSIQDAVGIKTTTAPVPNGGTITTNVSGPQTFSVTATDYEAHTTTASVTYTVRTPVEGTQDLTSQVDDAQLPPDIVEGLTDKLDAAINALNKGNKKAATNILNAFINMVNAQRGKSITNEQADALIQAAQDILDSINAS